MRHLLFISAMLFGVCQGQAFISAPTNEPKASYSFILVFRKWESYMVYRGDAASSSQSWVTHINGYSSLSELLSSLNIKDWNGRPSVSMSENEFIAIYDITTAKKIEVRLNTEEKSLPKRVEIQAEKWTEQKYEVKNH